MKVLCINGLCDRLAMVFSYFKKAKKNKEELTVCWPIDKNCNGHFLDIFEPVNGIKFTDNPKNPDFHGWYPLEEFNPKKQFIYDDLRLKKNIDQKITDLRKSMGNYIAVHVRRTDKLDPLIAPWFKNIENDEFFSFIDNQKKDYNKIFLACDCRETQNEFEENYGDKISYYSKITPSDSLRQTSLEIAAIDLFTCIHASNFFGTKLSGYSELIYQFRKNKLHKKIKFI